MGASMVMKMVPRVNLAQLPDSNFQGLRPQALGNYDTVLVLDRCTGNWQ